MRLLEGDLAHPWTLRELAEKLPMVPGSLVRLFKSAVGLPPMAYLAQQRAEAAAALLLQDDRPISQIGASVGWPDPNYFARRFKAHFGLSARAYRSRFSDDSAFLRTWLHAES
ncbi:helix-turn-helix transcriptional regulator [Nonomuraea bangladeshensis]|uniref:helix-turn-helix transcriptional regulator n=1 Tax=Nonomuraea bangladeshensis TaxID=404385 RepID=UPI003CD060AA